MRSFITKFWENSEHRDWGEGSRSLRSSLMVGMKPMVTCIYPLEGMIVW